MVSSKEERSRREKNNYSRTFTI